MTVPEFVEEPTAAAYDPEGDTWRLLPPPPIKSRLGPQSAYTGQEILVWGGVGVGLEPLADGAAYDPETDTWRDLPDAPLEGGAGYVSAWTGSEWVVVAAGTEADPENDSGTGAAYDPATNSWIPLPRAPIPDGWASTALWTGSELLIVRLGTAGASSGATWDAVENTWSDLPANPALTEFDTYPFSVWTGDAAALFGGAPAGVWEFAPNERKWRKAASLAETAALASPTWTGKEVIFYQPDGNPTLAYVPEKSEWTELPAAPDRDREFWQSAWTGEEVIIWGGSNPRGGAATTDGMLLRLDS
jgi:hypothetical protein